MILQYTNRHHYKHQLPESTIIQYTNSHKYMHHIAVKATQFPWFHPSHLSDLPKESLDIDIIAGLQASCLVQLMPSQKFHMHGLAPEGAGAVA